jgi:hypothetical protein
MALVIDRLKEIKRTRLKWDAVACMKGSGHFLKADKVFSGYQPC